MAVKGEGGADPAEGVGVGGAGTVPLNGAAGRTDIFTLYKHTAKEKEEKEPKKLNQVGLIRFFNPLILTHRIIKRRAIIKV